MMEPPKNYNAEVNILGCLMKKNDLIKKIEINYSDFFYQAHQIIFLEMIEMMSESLSIDPISLSSRIEQHKEIILDIYNQTYSTSNYQHSAELVRDCSIKRALISECNKALGLCSDSRVNAFDIASKTRDIFNVIASTGFTSSLTSMMLVDEDAEIKKIAQTEWLIMGVIPYNSFGVLYGDSGAGKSFVSLGMAMHISSGMDWADMDTAIGSVIYISAEGGSGMRIRKRAWEIAHKTRCEKMYIITVPVYFDDDDSLRQLESAIEAVGPPKLLVIDTLARCMTGNENDTKDMGRFIAGCDRIKNEFGCSILVIHHTGKDKTKGARGSSSLRAACDFEIMLDGDTKTQVTIESTKGKDFYGFDKLTLMFDQVDIGLVNYKHDKITSLVPRLANFSEKMASVTKLNDAEQVIMDVLCSDSAKIQDKNEVRRLVFETAEFTIDDQNYRNKKYRRALEGLQKKMKISIHETEIEIHV